MVALILLLHQCALILLVRQCAAIPSTSSERERGEPLLCGARTALTAEERGGRAPGARGTVQRAMQVCKLCVVWGSVHGRRTPRCVHRAHTQRRLSRTVFA